MKVREIILDFTSLLDVIMIILFFFVLYSTIGNNEKTEKATNEANETIEYYNELIEKNEKEQEEWREETSKEVARIKSIDENAAASEEALSAFERGEFYKFSLEVAEKCEDWTLEISFNEKQLDVIKSNENVYLKERIMNILKKSDFSIEKKYICILSYDGKQYGTANAFDDIKKAIDGIQREYPNLYFSNLNK